jgi:hypothetical protein
MLLDPAGDVRRRLAIPLKYGINAEAIAVARDEPEREPQSADKGLEQRVAVGPGSVGDCAAQDARVSEGTGRTAPLPGRTAERREAGAEL